MSDDRERAWRAAMSIAAQIVLRPPTPPGKAGQPIYVRDAAAAVRDAPMPDDWPPPPRGPA